MYQSQIHGELYYYLLTEYYDRVRRHSKYIANTNIYEDNLWYYVGELYLDKELI